MFAEKLAEHVAHQLMDKNSNGSGSFEITLKTLENLGKISQKELQLNL